MKKMMRNRKMNIILVPVINNGHFIFMDKDTHEEYVPEIYNEAISAWSDVSLRRIESIDNEEK